MKIAEMSWRDAEAAAARDPRCVLPLGSVEQHSGLSLATDAILAERVATEAAAPLGVPVYPAMPFGLAPYFTAFPGTISLRVETLLAVMRDLVASCARSGFSRVLIVNGHGGNNPVGALAQELSAPGGVSVKFHNWWAAPATMARAKEIDPTASHANWMENFPWTRLVPDRPGEKPMVDIEALRPASAEQVRAAIEDGSYGGPWQRPDADMLALWATGVAETRAALEGPWPA